MLMSALSILRGSHYRLNLKIINEFRLPDLTLHCRTSQASRVNRTQCFKKLLGPRASYPKVSLPFFPPSVDRLKEHLSLIRTIKASISSMVSNFAWTSEQQERSQMIETTITEEWIKIWVIVSSHVHKHWAQYLLQFMMITNKRPNFREMLLL